MKQKVKVLATIAGISVLGGCATVSAPVAGGVYTNVKHSGFDSGIVDENVRALKTGVATCTSVLGMFASGDCSEDEAMRNGGISKIHSSSNTSTSFFGIFGKYETIVVGE